MNVASWLKRASRLDPARVALYAGTAPWATYGALLRRVSRVAGGLRRRERLAPGDRVAIAMRNAPEYLVALYATWWAGLAAVPVNAKLHPREVEFIVANAGARCVIDDPAQVAALEGDAIDCEPCDAAELAWLFYTSGTTGRPKGAMLSHRNLVQMTLGYFGNVDAVAPTGRLLHAAPMSHGSGLYTFTHLATAASQVVPESGAFEAGEVLELLDRHDDVSMFAAPTMVKRVAGAARASPRGLRTLVYGGGPMYLADLHEATARLGERLAQIYGQGESPMTITVLSKFHHADRANPRHEARLASVGVPQHGVEVALRDSAGRDVAPGEPGEVCVRGDVVMSGYWGQPEASAQALRDGWLWTGDVGVMDADGFLTLKDRSKDLIVSGGSNIYPREVEEVLLRHPGVAEACVVGRVDREWGEVVVAFVVPRGAAPDTAELDRLCLEHIARFKRPREYRFVDGLPKNHYGKVLKSELRAALR
ncbi:MAG TPA: AMP-binding protein [Usitatibacter sp.]|jgi:long-chain acyl-CoA synthetase|nr:AMP-binding protein [Usitatibacter sp.]